MTQVLLAVQFNGVFQTQNTKFAYVDYVTVSCQPQVCCLH